MTRVSGAEWYPGPVAGKTGYSDGRRNSIAGIIAHSTEGSKQGLLNSSQSPTGWSWHISNMKDGSLYQHYELEAVCYHAGNLVANEALIGIENEGFVGEPLTEAQVYNLWRVMHEIAAIPQAYQLVRGVTAFEHNEVWNWATPNAGPTACPSNRIPWARILQDGDPTMAGLLPINTNIAPAGYDVGATRIKQLAAYEDEGELWALTAGSLSDAIAAFTRGYKRIRPS